MRSERICIEWGKKLRKKSSKKNKEFNLLIVIICIRPGSRSRHECEILAINSLAQIAHCTWRAVEMIEIWNTNLTIWRWKFCSQGMMMVQCQFKQVQGFYFTGKGQGDCVAWYWYWKWRVLKKHVALKAQQGVLRELFSEQKKSKINPMGYDLWWYPTTKNTACS